MVAVTALVVVATEDKFSLKMMKGMEYKKASEYGRAANKRNANC